MARSVIRPKINGITKSIQTSDYSNVAITNQKPSSRILEENNIVKTITTSGYSNSSISYPLRYSEISSTLPFRVRFTTIGIEGYGPNNPAPIGIAVIGFNNYIL
jgi:hypothetical protein